MRIRSIALSTAMALPLLGLALPSANASTTPAPPFTQCPAIGVDTSCGILLVINADGTVSVLSDGTQGPYDQVEDTLIGVQNNSAVSIPSLTLTGTDPTLDPPFWFDGDGICTYTGDAYCSSATTGYEGPTTTFSNISSDSYSGEVDFTGGLASGASTYFSLEGAVSANSLTIIPPNQPPDCSQATPSRSMLWPPDHTMVSISVNGVTDPDPGDSATVTVTGVTQDEPLNALGDGSTQPDAVINSDGTVSLRAERSGLGDGRVYVVSFTGTDTHGATCTGTVSVSVPHDQRGAPAVDSGQNYNSLSAS